MANFVKETKSNIFKCYKCKAHKTTNGTIRYINNNRLCDDCNKQPFICGTCKICKSDVFHTSSFSTPYKCYTCDKIKNDNLTEIKNNLNEVLNIFKDKLKMFKNIIIMPDDKFNDMMSHLNTLTNKTEIHNYMFNSLNYPFYLLAIDQAVLLSQYVRDFTDSDTQIYHVFMPTIFNIYDAMLHKDMCGKDRLQYYSYTTLKQLFYVWSYCRLSRFNIQNYNIECYICLNNISQCKNIDYKSISVASIKNGIIICANCGTKTHLNCSITLNKCGICSHKLNTYLDMLVISKEYYFHSSPPGMKIIDNVNFEWTI